MKPIYVNDIFIQVRSVVWIDEILEVIFPNEKYVALEDVRMAVRLLIEKHESFNARIIEKQILKGFFFCREWFRGSRPKFLINWKRWQKNAGLFFPVHADQLEQRSPDRKSS